jgi:hypothetical protein
MKGVFIIMRINRLYLENHLPILAGMDKYSVELNLRNVNILINLMIGKMGSGKTYILSHLQPFASVGTLDNRSQDDLIIEEMNGLKIIEFAKGMDEYIIRHEYIWLKNEGKHTVKSYVEKNGIELNSNGNQGSFKTIIQCEFGIEPGFLRLLRLGNNVTNFINMTTTERKSFVSDLLAETEVYNLLYKKWSDDMRLLNSQSNMLANKLNHIGADKLNKLTEEYEFNSDALSDKSKEFESVNKKIYSLTAENETLLERKTLPDASKIQIQLQSDLDNFISQYNTLSDKINLYSNMPDVNEISKIIGGLDVRLGNVNERLNYLENQHNEKTRQLNELDDRKAMASHKDHMETLESTYNELLRQDELFQRELRGFECNYSSTFLTGFIGDLHTIDVLINDISQYDSESIHKIYNSDSTILRWAQKQVEILGARKMKLQKMINTMRYSEKYEAPSILYRPPFCPTNTCPFYKTHPYTIQKSHSNKDELSDEVLKYQNEISDIDIQAYKYADYQIIYSKIVNLRELWKKSSSILSTLGALNTTSLIRVLTNLENRVWYNYDKLVQILETTTKREKHYELAETLNRIKTELNTLKLAQGNNIDSLIDDLSTEIQAIVSEIDNCENERNNILNDITRYNQIYIDLSQLSILKDDFGKMKNEIQIKIDNIAKLERNIAIVTDNTKLLSTLNIEWVQLKNDIRLLMERNETIKATLNDIKYTRTEFDKVIAEKDTLKYMVEAVSAKDGIPLVLVEMFLNSCKDIINDLISTVTDEEFEILKFKIDESVFKIPYMINGRYVDDISKASQGQISIASNAISFALTQQSMFEYNIPLLDEVDGALYKSDRDKSMSMLIKQLNAIHAEQAFVISHNNTYEGQRLNIIMTTDEVVISNNNSNIMRVYL